MKDVFKQTKGCYSKYLGSLHIISVGKSKVNKQNDSITNTTIKFKNLHIQVTALSSALEKSSFMFTTSLLNTYQSISILRTGKVRNDYPEPFAKASMKGVVELRSEPGQCGM